MMGQNSRYHVGEKFGLKYISVTINIFLEYSMYHITDKSKIIIWCLAYSDVHKY